MKNFYVAAFAVLFMFNSAANAAEFGVQAKMSWTSGGTSTFSIEGKYAKKIADVDVAANFSFSSMSSSELRSFSLGMSVNHDIPWSLADDLPPAPEVRDTISHLREETVDALLGAMIQEEPPLEYEQYLNNGLEFSVPKTFTEQALAAVRDAARVKPKYRCPASGQTSVLSNGAGSATRY